MTMYLTFVPGQNIRTCYGQIRTVSFPTRTPSLRSYDRASSSSTALSIAATGFGSFTLIVARSLLWRWLADGLRDSSAWHLAKAPWSLPCAKRTRKPRLRRFSSRRREVAL